MSATAPSARAPEAGLRLAALPPLSVYVHFPWCAKKCPYCDFNSHEAKGAVPLAEYLEALVADLQALASRVRGRTAISVYFGGGTPSLVPPEAIARLLEEMRARLSLAPHAEVTLEANPGSADAARFAAYRAAGVNRLSLGIQSFDDAMLAALGRIHRAADARRAIEQALAAFDNVNLDLMYGLPGQTLAMARADVAEALGWQTAHLSFYQLSIEPNTVFWSRPPPLPAHEVCADIGLAIEQALGEAGFEHYEVSAFARQGRRCRHNLNYWEFGDYLGIGAGAHGKLSLSNRILRHERPKAPAAYLAAAGRIEHRTVAPQELVFEFMLNATRLREGFPLALFCARTGLGPDALEPGLQAAEKKGLLRRVEGHIQPTERGRWFLNELLQLFLP
jgi:oxygen-independent coproporphyrinogen-3 oxidase